MSKKHKTKPARPHWEQVVSRRSNGTSQTLIPAGGRGYWPGDFDYKESSTKKTPGK